MHQKHHIESFKCNKIKSNPIEPNSKNIEILKKYEFRELMFNSVRFGSVNKESSRVSLYYRFGIIRS